MPAMPLAVAWDSQEHPEKLGAPAEVKTFEKKSVYDTKVGLLAANMCVTTAQHSSVCVCVSATGVVESCMPS